jgi:probable F420-dependent oxidoreductase
MSVRIAVQLHPQHADYSDIERAVREADEKGVDVIYNWDHFFPLYGDPDGKHFEAWTMLGHWAGITKNAKIGPLVTCNSYRNPELLADMARTVNHMSGGRLVFSIGSGWFEKDYEEYGYEFGTAGGRLDALAEALPRIKKRWSEINPAPMGHLPTMIGGGGEKKTLRMVAEHADIWHYFYNPEKADMWFHKLDVLNEWCEKLARDRSEIEVSVGIEVEHIDQAERLREAGVVEFTFGLNGPEYDLSVLDPWLTWRDSL